jgi:hypothetical protein
LYRGPRGPNEDLTRFSRERLEEWPLEDVYGFIKSESVVRARRLMRGAMCCQWMSWRRN